MAVGIGQRALVRFCLSRHFRGKTRLENWLIDRVPLRLQHPFGFDIELDGDDFAERNWYFRCAEPDTARFFRSLLRPGMTFFDCGAHIGFYTLLAAERGCTTVAFEPTPDTFERLCRNVAINVFSAVD